MVMLSCVLLAVPFGTELRRAGGEAVGPDDDDARLSSEGVAGLDLGQCAVACFSRRGSPDTGQVYRADGSTD